MRRIVCDIRPGFSALAQLSAKWFHAVTDALNNMSGKNGIRITNKGDGGKQVELDIPAAKQALSIPSGYIGSIESHTDTGTDDNQNGNEWTWKSGGANGLTMDVYCRVSQSGAYSSLARCRLVFSRDGLLMSAQELEGQRQVRAV